MKLQKFDYEMKDNAKKNRASKIIIVIVAFVACLVIYKTYALFQVTTTASNIIKGRVGNFQKPIIVSGDIDTVGSEVCYGDQCFYVIGDDENDSSKVKLLAKYNLLAGSYYNSNDGSTTDIPSNTEGYNLQSSTARGYVENADTYVVLINFSEGPYWYSSELTSLKPEYGTTYPAYVYDDNTSIKTYVDNYKDILEEDYGATIEEARLMKSQEIADLGCEENGYCDTSVSWLYQTTFWTGDVTESDLVYVLYSNGNYTYDNYTSTNEGVRPVIVVSKEPFYSNNILSGDVDTIGSEVAIGSQKFYVIGDDENDSSKVKLLAKYNLLVGYKNYREGKDIFTSSDKGYNLQSSEAIGFKSGDVPYIGTTEFNSNKYWIDGSNLKPEYGASFPAYVYDNNSNVFQYIDVYENKLEEMGAIIEESRVIKIEELVALGCDISQTSTYTCKTDTIANNNRRWVYNTSYWTGTVRDSIGLFILTSSGKIQVMGPNSARDYGVRPVIIVSKSIFE